MDHIIPISDLQSKAKRYVDQVKKTDEPVIVTQRGRAAAVLVSYEAYEGLLATRDETAFPDWNKRLARAKREAREGRGEELERHLRRTSKRP